MVPGRLRKVLRQKRGQERQDKDPQIPSLLVVPWPLGEELHTERQLLALQYMTWLIPWTHVGSIVIEEGIHRARCVPGGCGLSPTVVLEHSV